ncbi:MAG TPA: hypothetical protein DCS42_13095 [Nitrospiraceae bacterium]|nr:MAG: hypothetical protein A2072_01545 [Nitrospirae bacterium GWC1_57_7]HAS54978.1 hypothetical protein [Nitrospiraceae bacterium]
MRNKGHAGVSREALLFMTSEAGTFAASRWRDSGNGSMAEAFPGRIIQRPPSRLTADGKAVILH